LSCIFNASMFSNLRSPRKKWRTKRELTRYKGRRRSRADELLTANDRANMRITVRSR